MKKVIYAFLFLMLSASFGFAQVDNIADFNRADVPLSEDMPYFNSTGGPGNIGVRTVWVTDDLDQDGKPEVIATDYSNNGRVHVMELNGDALEIVWSSPIDITHTEGTGQGSPRWIRTGDLDGDGNGEIVFPLSKGDADYKLLVYQWDGTDNGYELVLTLLPSDFAGQGVGDFRMNREVASLYDFDGDGKDELITVNRDNNTYILGITGNFSTGFAAWQIEGGLVSPPHGNGGTITPGSEWHSVPADINGDGQIDIVNHHWNFYSFWSIEPTGADSYQYPDTTQDNVYVEMLNAQGLDAVAYMGIQPVDVDGDGKDELAGITYGANYDLTLISFDASDDPLYSWDTSKFAVIASNLWELAGHSAGSHWGIGAADLNGNGRTEILVGGSNGYNVISVEYNGSGSVLDGNNYTKTIIYPGDYINKYSKITINDSSGVIDTLTTGSESPFVSKMYAGSDINDNGKLEIAVSYQSVFDSITYVYQHWADTAYVEDSSVAIVNPDQITVRLLEATVTGIKAIDLAVVAPDDYKLEQNYPNPFNPTTTIRFILPLQKKISLRVYDILGNEVKTLIDNQGFQKGAYEVTWDGTNNFGYKVASGQYIYTLKYGNFSQSKKMTLLK